MSTKRAVGAAALAASISVSALTVGTGLAPAAPMDPTPGPCPNCTHGPAPGGGPTHEPQGPQSHEPQNPQTNEPQSPQTNEPQNPQTTAPPSAPSSAPETPPGASTQGRRARRRARRAPRAQRRRARRAGRALRRRVRPLPRRWRRRRPNPRTRPTLRAELTSGALRKWAVPLMCAPASASWAMARRRHRRSGGSAGMTAHPRAVRHPTGSARRLRVAGTVHHLPAAGTVGGTGHHATSSSRSAISARLPTTPSRSFRSSIRSSAVGVSGTSVSGFRCTDQHHR